MIILFIHAVVILVTWRGVVWLSWLQKTLELYGCQQLNKWKRSYTHSHLKLSLYVDRVLALVELDLYKYWDSLYNAKLKVSPWNIFQGQWCWPAGAIKSPTRVGIFYTNILFGYNNSNNYFFIGIQWKFRLLPLGQGCFRLCEIHVMCL